MFFDALAEERGVRHLLETGHAIMGFPLHLLDPAFRLVARVGGDDLRDPRWLEYRETGTISEEQLLKIKKSGFLASVQGKRGPSVDPGQNGLPDVIGCDVIGAGRLLGRLGVWATRPYGEPEFETVRLLARALAIELQRNPPEGTERQQYGDYFLTRLLSDGKISAREIGLIAKRLNITIAPPVRTVVMQDAVDSGGDSWSPQYLTERLRLAFPNARVEGFEDSIVMLFPAPDGLENRDTPQARGLAAFAAKNCLNTGISRRLPELGKTREGYRQARAAIRLGSGTPRFTFYEDIFALDLASLCSGRVDVEDLVYPPLLALQSDDREHGAEHLRTLETYIDKSCNMAETARSLGVHYNTVKYRMDVIREILGVDLDDMTELLKLRFSLLVLKNLDRLREIGL